MELVSWPIPIVKYMKDSGKMTKKQALAFSYFQINVSILDTIRMANLMLKEHIYGPLASFIKDIGGMERDTVLANGSLQMAATIKENGE